MMTLTQNMFGRHSLFGESIFHCRDVGRVDVRLSVHQRLRRRKRRKRCAVALRLSFEQLERTQLGPAVFFVVIRVDDPILGVDYMVRRLNAAMRSGKDHSSRDDVNQIKIEITTMVRVIRSGSRHHHHVRVKVFVENASIGQYAALRKDLD